MGEEQSHVAGDVEGSREPAPGPDVELPAALAGHLSDGRHGVLEALGVHGGAVAHRSEVRQVEHVRA